MFIYPDFGQTLFTHDDIQITKVMLHTLSVYVDAVKQCCYISMRVTVHALNEYTYAYIYT